MEQTEIGQIVQAVFGRTVQRKRASLEGEGLQILWFKEEISGM